MGRGILWWHATQHRHGIKNKEGALCRHLVSVSRLAMGRSCPRITNGFSFTRLKMFGRSSLLQKNRKSFEPSYVSAQASGCGGFVVR